MLLLLFRKLNLPLYKNQNFKNDPIQNFDIYLYLYRFDFGRKNYRYDQFEKININNRLNPNSSLDFKWLVYGPGLNF